VRLNTTSPAARGEFWRLIEPYAKIRMLGSAAMSLLQVARGAADVYAEASIMLWDVAAGLAVVEGAGGKSSITATNRSWCYDVIASNGFLWPQVSGYTIDAECRRQPPKCPI
jgi:myo-inositol-1(or 4)-monophosphatase